LIRIEVDPFPSNEDLERLFAAAWGSGKGDYADKVLTRSLAHVGAFEGGRLMGFVNIAWDGNAHAFLLDTTVHPEVQRQGIATAVVKRAVDIARERGADWLHVDCEPHLERFYRGCGFQPTAAGLIKLK
jgi:GNAT superfamily N-acetyltransferase